MRLSTNFDFNYVIHVIRIHDCRDESTKSPIGFQGYPFCIVMPAGDRSLSDVIASENLAQESVNYVAAMVQIALAVQHLHVKQIIHGDLKGERLICFLIFIMVVVL